MTKNNSQVIESANEVINNSNIEAMNQTSEKVATTNAITKEIGDNNKKEKEMGILDLTINNKSAIKEYDNIGAYNTVQEMMNRKEQLIVKFYVNKENTPCAFIESAHVAPFSYQLKRESLQGLINYLFNGEVTDFDSNPKKTDTLEENTDFQLGILKTLIKAGKTIQYVPLFRERPENLSAILPCFKGKVIFRIKRTEDTLSYLRENKQAV